jgi:ABC-type methionine transport system ATPase subunit
MNSVYLLEPRQLQDNRPTEIELKLRVPQSDRQEPIISQLILQYQLKVIFLSAILGKNGQGDGWFHLKLIGTSQQINHALTYLSEKENNSQILPMNLAVRIWLGFFSSMRSLILL